MIDTTILGDIPRELLDNARASITLFNGLEVFLKAPLTLTSGYRTSEQNKKVGGSETSAHLKALAIDIAPSGELIQINNLEQLCHDVYVEGTSGDTATAIKNLGYGLDQVILELKQIADGVKFHTLHIGLRRRIDNPRKEKLTQFRTTKGKITTVTYVRGFSVVNNG